MLCSVYKSRLTKTGTNTGKTTATYEVILCGRCLTTGNGTSAIASGLDSTMWITRTTLQGFPNIPFIGLKVFSESKGDLSNHCCCTCNMKHKLYHALKTKMKKSMKKKKVSMKTLTSESFPNFIYRGTSSIHHKRTQYWVSITSSNMMLNAPPNSAYIVTHHSITYN